MPRDGYQNALHTNFPRNKKTPAGVFYYHGSPSMLCMKYGSCFLHQGQS